MAIQVQNCIKDKLYLIEIQNVEKRRKKITEMPERNLADITDKQNKNRKDVIHIKELRKPTLVAGYSSSSSTHQRINVPEIPKYEQQSRTVTIQDWQCSKPN